MDTYFLFLTIVNSIILFVVFGYLYYEYRDRFVGLWCVSGLVLIVKACADLLMILLGDEDIAASSIYSMVDLVALAVSGYFLLMGSFDFINKPLSKNWRHFFVLGIIWCCVGTFLDMPPILSSLLPAVFMAISIFYTGLNIFDSEEVIGLGRTLGGGALIVWSVHLCLYPFTRSMMQLAAYGYFVTAVVSLIASIALLNIYFQRLRKEIEQSESRFRLLAENAQDVIFRFSLWPKYGYDYISPAVETLTGYKVDDFYDDPELLQKITLAGDLYQFESLKRPVGREGITIVQRIQHKNNRTIWVEQRCMPIYNEVGRVVAYEGIARDITESKKVESELKYLSQHDALTDLGNRLYFEEEIRNLENEEYSCLGVIVCDIDGLKIVNDTFGHASGDQLIKTAAGILKKVLSEDGKIARIGGDEFAVILVNYNEDMLEKVCYALSEEMSKHNAKKTELPINMSVGYASCEGREKTPHDLFTEADNKMYGEKMKNKNISQMSILSAMKRILNEKDFGQEGHIQVVQKIVLEMGRILNLAPEQMERLDKLARYHDIGKVGISDEILFKRGPLNWDEILEMRRHCEIGYRIAQFSDDLSPIAELILKHHEWWDGNGYPFRVKGKSIPLECRILAFADAYDGMVSERPYRKVLSPADAIKEIEQCKGTQFDPELVDVFIQAVKNILGQS